MNFGIQIVWGAVLAVSLQARCIQLAPDNAIFGYAIVAACGAAIAACTQLFAGYASDRRAKRLGRRHDFYLFGMACALPLLFVFYLTPSLVYCILAFFGLQIAMNLASGPYQAVIADHVELQSHGATASWMTAMQSLGAAAGLLTAGFVTQAAFTAAILSAALLISTMITFTYVRTLPLAARRGAPLPITQSLSILLISRGLVNIGFYMLMGFLLFFVRDSLAVAGAGAQRMTTALLFLTFTLTGIAGAALAARFAAAADRRLALTLANLVVIAALCGLSGSHGPSFAFAAAAVAGVGWGAFVTIDWALACAVLPQESIATAMGVWNLASVVPQIIAPSLAAPLVVYGDSLGRGYGARFAMVAAAVSFFLGTLWLWRLPKLRAAPAGL